MDRQRTVLLVEDDIRPYRALKEEFAAAGWQVRRAEDKDSTLALFEEMACAAQTVDMVVLDLGLPPERDNPLRVGIPLARALRERDDTLPILAYTGMSLRSADSELLVAKLLPLRVSLIYTRNLSVSLTTLLELVWQGFVLLSPPAAEALPQAAASKPDLLSKQLWETLKLLSEGLSDKEIAQKLDDVGEHGVKTRLRSIREILSDNGELETTSREDLISWYRRNFVRYRRD